MRRTRPGSSTATSSPRTCRARPPQRQARERAPRRGRGRRLGCGVPRRLRHRPGGALTLDVPRAAVPMPSPPVTPPQATTPQATPRAAKGEPAAVAAEGVPAKAVTDGAVAAEAVTAEAVTAQAVSAGFMIARSGAGGAHAHLPHRFRRSHLSSVTARAVAADAVAARSSRTAPPGRAGRHWRPLIAGGVVAAAAAPTAVVVVLGLLRAPSEQATSRWRTPLRPAPGRSPRTSGRAPSPCETGADPPRSRGRGPIPAGQRRGDERHGDQGHGRTARATAMFDLSSSWVGGSCRPLSPALCPATEVRVRLGLLVRPIGRRDV